jgi:hypothetical protein
MPLRWNRRRVVHHSEARGHFSGTCRGQLDTTFVATHFHLTADQIRAAAAAALAASPHNTALFLFQKTVDLFCQSLPAAES